jgi:hypothetical protein
MMAEATPTKRQTMKVKFLNNEDPDLDLAFSFQGKDMDQPERYHLYPGQVYELPKDVIDHLNSQEYPIYRAELDQQTGQVRHTRSGSFNRFTCHPMG